MDRREYDARYLAAHPDKRKESTRRWREANKDKIKAQAVAYKASGAARLASRRHSLAKYGLTIEDYERLAKRQNSLCCICGKAETHVIKGTLSLLKVDHDHKTGKVRGLLCNYCNLRLGHLLEDADWIAKALEYLANGDK